MFRNLTPHFVVLMVGALRSVIPPDGIVARCTAFRQVVGNVIVDGMEVPITKVVLGDIVDLPEPVDGVTLIVSLVVAQRAARDGRTADILVPDDAVRDAEGRIIGCRALAIQG